MNIFITGVNGQLGHDAVNRAAARGHRITGSDLHQEYLAGPGESVPEEFQYCSLDITDRSQVFSAIEKTRPDAVIHCAAWTAVDAAEDPENREKVDRINHLGTEYIAQAVRAVDAKMLYVSTDYVFDGRGTEPRKPDDRCFAPLNVYGRSKLDGEIAVRENTDKYFIVRTAWLFGLNGKNFINTMIRIGKTHDEVRVVNDQIGTPTFSYDLAGLLAEMAESDKYGCYHATNSESEPGGFISWFDFCCEIFRQYGLNTKVIPVTTAGYGLSAASRPFNSRMDKSKLTDSGFSPLPVWQDAVGRYLKEAKL